MSVQRISNLLSAYNVSVMQRGQTVSANDGETYTNKQAIASSPQKPVSVPANIALAQFSKVNFGGRYNYGRDDLSAYYEYDGPKPPQIEIKKYQISKEVDKFIEEEDYLSAIKGKIQLASICKEQGKDSDAYILEESVRRLYKDLPFYQKSEAKEVISDYNFDMAAYIDEDIKRY